MNLDFPSVGIGVVFCLSIIVAYYYGQQSMIRMARRVARHGRDLDRVFFEDAERDATIERPKPVAPRAELHSIEERQSGR